MSDLRTVLLVLGILIQGDATSENLRSNNGHLKNATCCHSQAESDVVTWHDGAKRAGHTFGIESHQKERSLDQTLTSVGLSKNCSVRYTWSVQKHFNTSTSCECGSELGHKISCNITSHQVSLLQCYCMTYSKHNNELVVGSCFYGCFKKGHGPYYNRNAHYPLPMKPLQLNQLCKKYNRDGQLCGKCLEGFAPPVYSYSLSCVNCTDYTKNWVKYIAISFLPLTGFFILVVTFRISATSGTMNTFVLLSQTMTMPVIMRVLTLKSVVPESGLILISFYSIWNLDFFRPLYPPFCLHPKMTTVQALALDYAIAIYPLVLIAITYLLVEMHDNNFRILVWLWKPFHRCFVCFRRGWDIKASLIDAFATFILLSYVKFLSVSFDLLVPVHIFNVHGDSLSKQYLFYDGTTEYFGTEHLPYGILALVVLLVFNLLPLLLLSLYPCKCFQRCLNRCTLRCQALHIFMDALQGHYKDGTGGTRDCRWFATLYLIFRILIQVLFVTNDSIFFWLCCVIPMILVVTFLTAVFQPYKSTSYNNIAIFLSLEFIFVIVSVIVKGMGRYQTPTFNNNSKRMLFLSSLIPFLYLLGLLLYKLSVICHKRYACNTCQKIKSIILHSWCDQAQPGLEELLPDRMVHAEEYTPLLIDPVSDYKSDHPWTEQSNGQETPTY